jgi:hypothetical protein
MAKTTTTTIPSKNHGGKPNHHKKKDKDKKKTTPTPVTTGNVVNPNFFYQHEGVIIGSIVCLLLSIGALVVIGSFRKRS